MTLIGDEEEQGEGHCDPPGTCWPCSSAEYPLANTGVNDGQLQTEKRCTVDEPAHDLVGDDRAYRIDTKVLPQRHVKERLEGSSQPEIMGLRGGSRRKS
jgi:hypothetical protein